MPGHVICIAGQKGGTGKTVTAINLAASLAVYEKKTLLVDCDPQGSATTGLGINKKRLSIHLCHVLKGEFPIENAIIRDVRLKYLHIMPTTFQLFKLQQLLADKAPGIRPLNEVLCDAAQGYDYIILDTPPSLGALALNAIAAADWLLLPVQHHLFAMEGLGQLLLMVQRLKSRINPHLKIAGVLFTMMDNTFSSNPTFDQKHLNVYREILLSHHIPEDKKIHYAADIGRPLLLQDITSAGAVAYLGLAAELIAKIEGVS
jgi:chromosome partitioning protein